MFRKLNKASIVSSKITTMWSDEIVNNRVLIYDVCSKDVIMPEVPLALPAQATLLRGVCRIANKQTVYLLSNISSSLVMFLQTCILIWNLLVWLYKVTRWMHNQNYGLLSQAEIKARNYLLDLG